MMKATKETADHSTIGSQPAAAATSGARNAGPSARIGCVRSAGAVRQQEATTSSAAPTRAPIPVPVSSWVSAAVPRAASTTMTTRSVSISLPGAPGRLGRSLRPASAGGVAGMPPVCRQPGRVAYCGWSRRDRCDWTTTPRPALGMINAVIRTGPAIRPLKDRLASCRPSHFRTKDANHDHRFFHLR